MFALSDVIIREDEPSSLIAFCLSYPDYKEKLRKLRQAENAFLDPEEIREPNVEMERHMLKNTGTHWKYRKYIPFHIFCYYYFNIKANCPPPPFFLCLFF